MGYRVNEHIKDTGQHGVGTYRAYDESNGKQGYVNSSGYFIPDPEPQAPSYQSNEISTPNYCDSYEQPQQYYHNNNVVIDEGGLGDIIGAGIGLAKGMADIHAKRKELKKQRRFDKALSYYESGLYDKAFQLFKSMYDDGYADEDPDLIAYIGICYYFGNGVECNLTYAFKLFQMGYNQGSYLCAFKLSEIYCRGEIVEENYETALFYFEEAERLGMPECESSITLQDAIIQGLSNNDDPVSVKSDSITQQEKKAHHASGRNVDIEAENRRMAEEIMKRMRANYDK